MLVYPVGTAKASIRRTMLPNSRRQMALGQRQPVIPGMLDQPASWSEKIGQRELGILPSPRIVQVPGDQFTEARTFIRSPTRASPPPEVMRDP